jgi:hypothetical protein
MSRIAVLSDAWVTTQAISDTQNIYSYISLHHHAFTHTRIEGGSLDSFAALLPPNICAPARGGGSVPHPFMVHNGILSISSNNACVQMHAQEYARPTGGLRLACAVLAIFPAACMVELPK